MAQDFTKVLVKDNRLVVTDKLAYAVEKSGQNVTPQVYNAISANSSSITFNLQIPSEQTVLDLRAIMESDVILQFNFPAGSVPVGQYPIQYGSTDALAPFPVHQLFTTQSITVNNNTVSMNTRDLMPVLMSMVDKRHIMRYNGMCPNMADVYANYADGVGAINNPLGSYSNIGDNDLHPRGSYALTAISSDLAGQNKVTVSDGTAQTVYVRFTTREPLLLSPFKWATEETKSFYGIQNMNMTFNLGDCSRIWRSASSWFNGSTVVTVNQIASRLIMTQLTPHPSDLMPSRCVNSYYSLPRFITNVSDNIASAYSLSTDGNIYIDPKNKGTSVTSTNIQLNMIPDKVVIFVRPKGQTNNTPDYFASIRGISIQFNNNAGILSTASVSDLYRYSVESGSNQSFDQFYGIASKPSADPTDGFKLVPTTGSLLVLEFGRHIQIQDDYFAPGSLGNFQFQFNVNVVDQLNQSSNNWELVLVTVNSGLFVTERGTASTYQGILTRQDVLDVSSQEPYSRSDVDRMIGGGFLDTLKSTMGKVAPKLPGLLKQGLSMVDNPYAQKASNVLGALGYGRSGGGSSGGGSSGGRRHKLENKLME
jgi:hypothetical protein